MIDLLSPKTVARFFARNPLFGSKSQKVIAQLKYSGFLCEDYLLQLAECWNVKSVREWRMLRNMLGYKFPVGFLVWGFYDV